jgi:hypothetical protein
MSFLRVKDLQFFFFTVLLLNPILIFSQELFISTEPASNRPKGVLITKLGTSYQSTGSDYTIEIMPKCMYSLTANIMGSLGVTTRYTQLISPESQRFTATSFNGFLKYRFLNFDSKHKHFRMAALVSFSTSKNELCTPVSPEGGIYKGLSIRLIQTYLHKRFAFSGDCGLLFQNQTGVVLFEQQKVFTYILSSGYLIRPYPYRSYKETNWNFYLEWLGNISRYPSNTSDVLENCRKEGATVHFTEISPGLQFIFRSRSRLDLSCRVPAISKNSVNTPDFMIYVAYEHYLYSKGKQP